MSKNNKADAFLKFCPSCGTRIPEGSIDTKFCSSCGFNLGSFISSRREAIPTFKRRDQNKIKDEDIVNKSKAFWRPRASIFWPLISMVIMGQIIGVVLFIMIFLGHFSLETMDFAFSPLFIALSSFAELVFMVVPLLYVGQYFQNPTLKNRFKFLGLYSKKTDRFFVVKEVLLGIGFAIISVIIVNLVSLFLELIFEPFLSLSAIYSAQSSTPEVDTFISTTNIFDVILLSIIMIIIIGPSEEIAFRGFMQRGLVRSYSKKAGIWITAIIFSLIHIATVFVDIGNSPLSTIITFIVLFITYMSISLLLGYLFMWRNENLIAPIITHGVYNALTVIMAFIFYNLSMFSFSLFLIAIISICFFSFLSYYLINRI
jgi:membrane protease YdiL (CAAX protease family)